MLHSTSLGHKIANARKKSNLSQADLATKISISPQAVGKWERGESMPDITTLNRLAEIFGVDLNYFSDTFQSITNEKPDERHSVGLPTEPSIKEPTKRFDWNRDMSKSHWADADFSGLKDIKDQFNSSNIKNCKFVKSDLSGLTLKGNAITDCDFSQSEIRNGKFYASEISKSSFHDASLIDAEIQKSEIKNSNFDRSNLSGVEFINSTFQKNSIEHAVLKHTSFKNISFSEIIFSGNVEDCTFDNCSFRGVKFIKATILNTFFKHNRKLHKVEFLDCRVDALTFAFLKSNGANIDGITLIQEQNNDTI